jgi:hypothetical protein
MKKKKQLLLTCVISVLVLLSVFYFLSRTTEDKAYNVFLLNQDVLSGCKIEKAMVYSLPIPEKSLLPEACRTLDEIIGKYCNRDMKNGALISMNDLTLLQNGIIYPSVKSGNVLYSLALESDDANGWWMAKGNLVLIYIYDANLLTYDEMNSQTADTGKASVTIMESVRIIRLLDENGSEVTTQGVKPAMACLEVSKEQAQVLFDAENSKKIKLIPQNPTK